MVVARLAFISASKALVPDPIPGIPYLGIPGGFLVGLSSSNSSAMVRIICNENDWFQGKFEN